jgi:hypothetical protein
MTKGRRVQVENVLQGMRIAPSSGVTSEWSSITTKFTRKGRKKHTIKSVVEYSYISLQANELFSMHTIFQCSRDSNACCIWSTKPPLLCHFFGIGDTSNLLSLRMDSLLSLPQQYPETKNMLETPVKNRKMQFNSGTLLKLQTPISYYQNQSEEN